MKNMTEISTTRHLTSEAKTLIDHARAEGNTQLLEELQSAEALLPSTDKLTNTQAPSDLVK